MRQEKKKKNLALISKLILMNLNAFMFKDVFEMLSVGCAWECMGV